MSATFSPYWSQSGEELLRAWEARFGQKADGVITVDLQALARLMDLTGPVRGRGRRRAELRQPGQGAGRQLRLLRQRGRAPGDQRGRRAGVPREALPGRPVRREVPGARRGRQGPALRDVLPRPPAPGRLRASAAWPATSATPTTTTSACSPRTSTRSKADYWQTPHRSPPTCSSPPTAAPRSPSPSRCRTPRRRSRRRGPTTSRRPGQGPAVGLLHPLGRQRRSRSSCPRGAEVQGQATIRGLPFKPIVRSVLDRPYFYRKVLLEPGGQAVAHGQVPRARTPPPSTATR